MNIPPLQDGARYTQISAGVFHTVFLRHDGQAVSCGRNDHGQCDFTEMSFLSDLPHSARYTQVSAGVYHTVLLRRDGRAVACGTNEDGQCNIPDLSENITYTQVFLDLSEPLLNHHHHHDHGWRGLFRTTTTTTTCRSMLAAFTQYFFEAMAQQCPWEKFNVASVHRWRV